MLWYVRDPKNAMDCEISRSIASLSECRFLIDYNVWFYGAALILVVVDQHNHDKNANDNEG